MNVKHLGSSFDDFLTEEALLEEVTATAIQRVIAWQIDPTEHDSQESQSW